MPHGSILGPLLFIFLNYLFLFVTNSCLINYAVENTLYCFENSINDVNNKLKSDFALVIESFHENYMVGNAGKCHYVSRKKHTLYFNDQTYANSKEETMLRIIIDSKLSFYSYIKGLRKKTSQKLYVLTRIVPYLDLSQKSTIFKSIMKSQFRYCPPNIDVLLKKIQ